MSVCSKCGEKRSYLLWRIDCRKCEKKICPRCNKKKLGVFKLSENTENCTCDLAVDNNKERKCSFCNEALPESGLKVFCAECLRTNFGIVTETPKPVKNPEGKGGSFGIGVSFVILVAVIAVIGFVFWIFKANS